MLTEFYLFLWWAGQVLVAVFSAGASVFKTSAQLRLENIALRQQLAVLRRSAPKRLKLTPADRFFWVVLRRMWADWKSALLIVRAETVALWLQNIPIDLQSLKLIDVHLFLRSAQQHLFACSAPSPQCSKPRPNCDWKTSPCGNNSPCCVGRLPNG